MTTSKRTERALETLRVALLSPRHTRMDYLKRAITELQAIKTGHTPTVTYEMFAALIGLREPGETFSTKMIIDTVRIIEAVKIVDRLLNNDELTLPYEQVVVGP